MSTLPVARSAPGPSVASAYRYCENVTRRSGSSFAAAFWMLPKTQRHALHAIYAFCRLADDIADDPEIGGNRAALLKRWREELDNAYLCKARHPVGIALGDAVHRFRLPEQVFVDLLAGVEFDLAGNAIDSFDDLQLYCYRVASTVGLQVVRVLGYRNPQSLDYAETMGIAVQLTNVLRDIGHDASSGRIYLPREELDRFGVSADDLRNGRMTEELRLLLDFYGERARLYYERAESLLPSDDRRALRPAVAMGRIYRKLLEELHRKGFPCFGAPLRLSKSRRLAIAATVWLGWE
jgi:phytoene synthase